MITEVVCPVCKGLAVKDSEQENTVYCTDVRCNFMGMVN